MAYADGNIVIGTSVDMYGMNTGLARIEKSVRRLNSLMGAGIFAKFAKSAIDAGSDLQEVQNIVDVSFEDMSYKIEEFSKTSIENFGMSELASKQTAGSFTAMGKAIGFSLNKATDMSVTLTGLTGDFASFYNISQDYARVALSAVYTGETETLKRYGIVLTEANLQEYARQKGIDKTVHAMSAMEKAELRYNYILDQTSDIQGDFVRTQSSWANQTRVLQQVWNKFLVELGRGLIGILLPTVQALNLMVSALTKFIIILRDALFYIFSIHIDDFETSSKKAADNLEHADEAMGGLADGAKKAAKEARKTITPFDEINRLVDNTASNLGGGGGPELPLFQLPDGDGGILKQMEDAIKNESWSLFSLGQYIANKIADGLNSIDWEHVYGRFIVGGMGLAQFLNGLFQPAAFEAVARTLANSLNSVIKSVLMFSKGFDWEQLGISIATAINTFFGNFNFAEFAETLNKFIGGILTTLATVIREVDTSEIMKAIKTFINNLDFKTIAFLIATKLIKILPSIVSMLSSHIFDILEILSILRTNKSKGFPNLGPIAKAPRGIPGKTQFEKFAEVVSNFIKTIKPALKIIGSIASIIGGAYTAISNFIEMLKNGFNGINELFMIVGLAVAAVGAIIAGVAAAPALIVAAVVAAIATIVVVVKEHWEEIKAWASEKWEEFKNWIVEALAWIFEKVQALKDKAIELLDKATLWLKKIVLAAIEKILEFRDKVKEIFDEIKQWLYEHIILPIKDFFINLGNSISQSFSDAKNTVLNIWDSVTAWFSNKVIDPLKSAFSGLFSFIGNGAIIALNGLISGVETAINFIINALNLAISGINNLGIKAVSLFGGTWRGINPIANVSLPRIPALAKGAVIPPNAPFMAQLGDQKHGKNLEGPESLFRQIVKEESGLDILQQILQAILEIADTDIVLDGDKIGNWVTNYQRKMLRSGG